MTTIVFQLATAARGLSFCILMVWITTVNAQVTYYSVLDSAPSISASSIQTNVSRGSFTDANGKLITNDMAEVHLTNVTLGTGTSLSKCGFWVGRDANTLQSFLQFRPSIDPTLAAIPGFAGDIHIPLSDFSISNIEVVNTASGVAYDFVVAVLANAPALVQSGSYSMTGGATLDKDSVIKMMQDLQTALRSDRSGTYTKISLGLNAGWNLLGNGRTAGINTQMTFSDPIKIKSVWKWNHTDSKWAFYTPSLSASELELYARANDYDVLTYIGAKEGFWVNAQNATTLTGPVGHSVTLTDSDLKIGWNLVGGMNGNSPSQLNNSWKGTLSAAGKSISSIWVWDASLSRWKFFAPLLEAQGGTDQIDYIHSKDYLEFNRSISASEGVWVNVGVAGPTNGGFVATNGSDSNPGTIGLPYRTIQKCAATAASGSTCYIRAGTYYETVTPNSGITVTSYNNETVTIDGTDAVTGWTLHQGSIYKATVLMNADDTNQVFVGQQMMTEARWPNGDDLFHPNWATAKAGTTEAKMVDSNLPNVDWTNAKIHWWSGSDPWDHQTGVITTSQNGQLKFTLDNAPIQNYIIPMSGGYYYLFGTLSALDRQREWVYDSSENTLYFWAAGGVNPAMLDVRTKARQYAFDLSNKSNVTIMNIKLFGSTINMNAKSSNNAIDGVTAAYASHITKIPPNLSGFAHINDTGLVVDGSSNIIKNSTISYSASNGISISGSDNIVTNNLIHHVNYLGSSGSGITVQGKGHKIQNNTIHTTGRFSIFLTSVRYWPTVTNDDTDISNNNLYNAMLISRDGGAIYVSGTYLNAGNTVTGSRIHHNWAHDIQSYYPGPADNYTLTGIYLDESAAGWIADQNVLWNNQYYNIQLHGSTQGATNLNNNKVFNNSIFDIGPNSFILLLDVNACGSTAVTNNLVLTAVTQWGSSCTVTNNNATAPGAYEMTASIQVGCNFSGCESSPPPSVIGGLVTPSVALQPYDKKVAVGSSVTYTVRGAGSGPLTYQWRRSGTNISGATSAAYTVAAASMADNGSSYTVAVSNSVGSTMSNAALLTVE
jgi:hypothetical protein